MKAVDGATASPLDSSNDAGVDGAENSAGATAAEDPDTQAWCGCGIHGRVSLSTRWGKGIFG